MRRKTYGVEEISHRFAYWPPKEGQPEKYTAIRGKAKELATLINDLCPDSDEAVTAIQRCEEAVMWANAAIARRE